MARKYEFVLVLKPVQEKERKKILDNIKSWLSNVKFLREEEWGSKALKYKIKKELTGFYFDYEFETEKIPPDFEKKLYNTDGVLRHLLIRKK